MAGSSAGYGSSRPAAAAASAAAGSPSWRWARASPDRAFTAGSMSPVVSATLTACSSSVTARRASPDASQARPR